MDRGRVFWYGRSYLFFFSYWERARAARMHLGRSAVPEYHHTIFKFVWCFSSKFWPRNGQETALWPSVQFCNSKLCDSAPLAVLHFCVRNFVSGFKAHRALFLVTKLQIRKYDKLENIEKPNRALEVTLSSITDTNLGRSHTKYLVKKYMRGI